MSNVSCIVLNVCRYMCMCSICNCGTQTGVDRNGALAALAEAGGDLIRAIAGLGLRDGYCLMYRVLC